MNQRLVAWALAAVWAAVIFGLSSIPGLSSDLGTWDLILRKIAHFVEFAILGGLLYWATNRRVFSITLTSLYAATDEMHQAFVSGRNGAVSDWAIDTAGAIVGVFVATEILRRRSERPAQTAIE